MPRCSSCSAPLPKDSIICNYCGTRNDIDLPAVKTKHILPAIVSDRTCPNCDMALHSIDVGKNARFIIEKCPQCVGLFFDNYELERLVEETVKRSYWIDYQKVHSLLQNPRHKDKIIYRRCPVCSELMQRENYMNHSGVIMDVCRQDGIWLDAGEFKQIQEWMLLGGHNNPNRKNLDKRVLREHKKNKKRSLHNHKADKHEPSPDNQTPDPYLSFLSDLFSPNW